MDNSSRKWAASDSLIAVSTDSARGSQTWASLCSEVTARSWRENSDLSEAADTPPKILLNDDGQSKAAGDTKLGVADAPVGPAAIHRDLCRLEKWAVEGQSSTLV